MICRNNYPLLKSWIDTHASTLNMIEPRAGAIAFLRYHLPVNSTRIMERLLKEKSVLVVPGDHFGMDDYLRIGYGAHPDTLQQALEHIHDILETYPQKGVDKFPARSA